MDDLIKKRYAMFLHDDSILDYISKFHFVNSMKEKTIRFNSLKISEHDFLEEMKEERVEIEKKMLPYSFHAKANFSLGSTVSFLQGHYYVQSFPSQLAVHLLNLKEGMKVLDAAASPGGKTSLMAQYMNNTGLIVALEKFSHRFESLKANLQRMNVKNSLVLQYDAQDFQPEFLFDAILIDAPCSGNFFTDKEWFSKRKLNDFVENSKVQIKLLNNLSQFVKKNSVIVYSTCSLEPEEDEFVVKSFLETHDDFELVNIFDELNLDQSHHALDIAGEEIKKSCVRFWPHLHNEEGFFIAKFVKH